MSHYTSLPCLIGAFCMLYPASGSADTVQMTVELAQTGESARVDNPECATPNLPTAGDVVVQLGTALVDKSIGYPITGVLWENASPGNRDWLKARLGLNNGKSSCQTLCVTHPKVPVTYSLCISETGGDGLTCHDGGVESLNGDFVNTAWAAAEAASTYETGAAVLVCVTAKNWSHNRNRSVSLYAHY